MAEFPARMLGGGAILIAVMVLATAPRLSAASLQDSDRKLAQVEAQGVALTSTNVNLPDDAATFPNGLQVDAVNENCLACHSASMVLTQPRLDAAHWTAIVQKMRNSYMAPIPDGAVPDIVAYLAAMSNGLPSVQTSLPKHADQDGK